MKAVKKTGLVPVLIGRRVIGVPPADAIKGVAAGTMTLSTIPEGIETIDVAGQKASPKIEAAPAQTDGLIDIPENWREAHGSKRAMLAKAILGLEPKAMLPAPEGVEVGAFAIQVIESELARREASEPTDPSETNPAETPTA
jgi:hypothetical protein